MTMMMIVLMKMRIKNGVDNKLKTTYDGDNGDDDEYRVHWTFKVKTIIIYQNFIYRNE